MTGRCAIRAAKTEAVWRQTHVHALKIFQVLLARCLCAPLIAWAVKACVSHLIGVSVFTAGRALNAKHLFRIRRV